MLKRRRPFCAGREAHPVPVSLFLPFDFDSSLAMKMTLQQFNSTPSVTKKMKVSPTCILFMHQTTRIASAATPALLFQILVLQGFLVRGGLLSFFRVTLHNLCLLSYWQAFDC